MVLFVVTNHTILLWSISVNLRLLKATVKFLWWVGCWGGLHSNFCVQPNYSAEVVLCCVVVVVVTILYTVLLSQTRVNQCSSQLFHSWPVYCSKSCYYAQLLLQYNHSFTIQLLPQSCYSFKHKTDQYTVQLKASGYHFKETLEIIKSWRIGIHRKLERRKKEELPFHREREKQ